MRTLLIQDTTDLPSLMRRLGAGGGKADTVTAALKRLNPHLNLDRLMPGTLLLVPDDPSLDLAATHGVGGAQVNALVAELKTAVDAAVAAALKGLGARATERQEVTEALKAPAIKRAIDADADLKARAASVAAELKKEVAADKEAEKSLKQLQTSALGDIETLAKVWGERS